MLSGRGPKGERGFKNIFLFMLFYRVHHAIIQNLDQKLQKTENFYLATILDVKDQGVRKFKFQHLGVIQGAHRTPKIGWFFSKFMKLNIFVFLITQLVKKLQQWSLYEVIGHILPFVLNTKQALSNIWLLSYDQNSYITVSKYRPEAVLYSKQMAGHPLSPHIKTTGVALLLVK